jgi:hypothetical protein
MDLINDGAYYLRGIRATQNKYGDWGDASYE